MKTWLDRLQGRHSRQREPSRIKPVRRMIVLSEIITRAKRASVAVASPADFGVRFARILGDTPDDWPGTPYCFSYARERLLLAVCHDEAALVRAPFLWKAQFDEASQIAAIPFERLHEFTYKLPRRPIIIFSIGRCGSTLFSKILNACGMHTLSEPDILTQLAVAGAEDRTRMGQEMRALLLKTCISVFCKNAMGPVAIKLRSQCNGMASEIANVFADARFVVMLRDRHGWMRSRIRAFGGEPRTLAMLYKRGIQTYHELHRRGAAPMLIWYEDMIANPERILEQLMLPVSPGMGGSRAGLRLALEEDSQAGTPLDRTKLKERPLSDESVRVFDEEWNNIRPDALIRLYSLDRIK